MVLPMLSGDDDSHRFTVDPHEPQLADICKHPDVLLREPLEVRWVVVHFGVGHEVSDTSVLLLHLLLGWRQVKWYIHVSSGVAILALEDVSGRWIRVAEPLSALWASRAQSSCDVVKLLGELDLLTVSVATFRTRKDGKVLCKFQKASTVRALDLVGEGVARLG